MNKIINTINSSSSLQNAYLFFGENQQVLYDNTLLLSQSLFKMPPDTSHPTIDTLRHLAQSPDFIFESSDNAIKLETIKTIQIRIQYGPSHYPIFLVIIDHAHRLTPEAANAFLKTIEEPPNNVHFIFLTTSKSQVLPTILSRCNSLYFATTTALPAPEIDFLTLQKLPLHHQFEQLSPFLKDKPALKTLLYGWVNTLWHSPPQNIPSPHIFDMINTIIFYLNRLEYNVNTRLQLEALLCEVNSV